MATPNTQETKQSLRKSLQETRRKTQLGSFDAEQLTKRALFELSKTTGDVAIYMSLPEEPPTENLIQEVRKLNRNVWLPRINNDELLWIKNPTEFYVGPYGIKEPLGDGVLAKDLVELGAIILPGLAVDVKGTRLGKGKGFYDRVLVQLNENTKRIVLLFDTEFILEVPKESHDQPIHTIATPYRSIHFTKPD
ncbi:MAG: 5-formyltetrahydrofolate cyclo-ligase [Actinobacteria bacterium]|nr:5-formyltetrahydrofolate cyclo-ligase [Actinomycetota bacterium]